MRCGLADYALCIASTVYTSCCPGGLTEVSMLLVAGQAAMGSRITTIGGCSILPLSVVKHISEGLSHPPAQSRSHRAQQTWRRWGEPPCRSEPHHTAPQGRLQSGTQIR